MHSAAAPVWACAHQPQRDGGCLVCGRMQLRFLNIGALRRAAAGLLTAWIRAGLAESKEVTDSSFGGRRVHRGCCDELGFLAGRNRLISTRNCGLEAVLVAWFRMVSPALVAGMMVLWVGGCWAGHARWGGLVVDLWGRCGAKSLRETHHCRLADMGSKRGHLGAVHVVLLHRRSGVCELLGGPGQLRRAQEWPSGQANHTA